ncbi:hypothetical protein EYZ11_009286 [Aspergillus tanneri]|uniref:Uncharacterized protein n=1 Tax=Aspergillus tanneri TaxID=1220188 RepID=A0A4S3JAE2_9EURO|nr:hypothetical protein EYZ11_009286 [Aspergillus tanneri]
MANEEHIKKEKQDQQNSDEMGGPAGRARFKNARFKKQSIPFGIGIGGLARS